MALIVKAFGIIFLVLGVVMVLKPSIGKSMIDFMKVGKRCYIGGVIRILLGLFFLASIKYVSLPWVTGIIGGITFIGGILIFVMGIQRMHSIMDRIYNMPENKMRILPALLSLVGVLIIYAA